MKGKRRLIIFRRVSFLFPKNTEAPLGLAFPRHSKAFHNSLPQEKTFTDTSTNSEERENENTIINGREMVLPPKPSKPLLQQGRTASSSKHAI